MFVKFKGTANGLPFVLILRKDQVQSVMTEPWHGAAHTRVTMLNREAHVVTETLEEVLKKLSIEA